MNRPAEEGIRIYDRVAEVRGLFDLGSVQIQLVKMPKQVIDLMVERMADHIL